MPGKQRADCAGLRVEGKPTGERGLYFTDETFEVSIELHNLTEKRLRGTITIFYGFGPSGLEGNTYEEIIFDMKPNDKQEVKALRRLVGIQGNGIIGMFLPRTEEDAIISDSQTERVLKLPERSNYFHTLYTFTTMEREFYTRFHEQPRKLTKIMVALTIIIGFLTVILVLQAFGVLPN